MFPTLSDAIEALTNAGTRRDAPGLRTAVMQLTITRRDLSSTSLQAPEFTASIRMRLTRAVSFHQARCDLAGFARHHRTCSQCEAKRVRLIFEVQNHLSRHKYFSPGRPAERA